MPCLAGSMIKLGRSIGRLLCMLKACLCVPPCVGLDKLRSDRSTKFDVTEYGYILDDSAGRLGPSGPLCCSLCEFRLPWHALRVMLYFSCPSLLALRVDVYCTWVNFYLAVESSGVFTLFASRKQGCILSIEYSGCSSLN